jgi:uncharacterized protein YydD (DUF2326 family)
VCIELDTLDEAVLLTLLEEKLKGLAGLQEDEREADDTLDIIETTVAQITFESLENYRNEYSELQERFNKIYSHFERLKDELMTERREVEMVKQSLEEKIKNAVVDVIEYSGMTEWIEPYQYWC